MNKTPLDEITVYTQKTEGQSLKLQPKSIFSGDYKERKNLRVAAYIRVSTDRKEQETSFETQYHRYNTFIAEQKDWIFAGIYADTESGTSLKKRAGFKQMVADAKTGKFDMVITKSVSRYARNLIDGIQTARDLLMNNPPVGIMFEEEGLNTFRPDSEFLLSVMLLIAQGESEKRSKAVKKAYIWRCDAHNYLTPVGSLLGYTKDENKNMVIEPEGAKTVKAIFAMYLYGLTATHIAYILTASGKITGKGREVWSASGVTGILKNERHCGDIIAQKTVTTDTLQHKSEKNIGQEVLHYYDNHHEGIVSRDEYIRSLLLMRANCASPYYNPQYEIRVIREGLLAGFIPLNFAFGGYDAEHYLGAEAISGVEIGNYALDILNIPACRLVRSQEIEHHFAAQMTVSYKGLVFNTDCISKLPNNKYAEVLLHPAERLIAVRPTDADNRNAIPWDGRCISSSSLCPILYTLLGWNPMWKYKIMADCFIRGKDRVLIFNLSQPEFQFVETISEDEEIKRRIRRLLQPGAWSGQIGVDYITQMVVSRRAYALSLKRWKIHAPALPIENFPGNPTNRNAFELKEYLETLGVKYDG
ncbi:recombinase family protein [Eubacteriales bacterium OttesenSCG-928-G02]|nr:recombinase family protein [Eubacteriales bacterium OttesenSCG-928-G02]